MRNVLLDEKGPFYIHHHMVILVRSPFYTYTKGLGIVDIIGCSKHWCFTMIKGFLIYVVINMGYLWFMIFDFYFMWAMIANMGSWNIAYRVWAMEATICLYVKGFRCPRFVAIEVHCMGLFLTVEFIIGMCIAGPKFKLCSLLVSKLF